MPTIDFDESWAEVTATREPIAIVAFGDRVVLPDELPAKVLLLTERNRQRAADSTITLEDVLEVLVPFVGQDRVDAWLDRGMSITRAMEITSGCRRAYMQRLADDKGDGDGAGEARPGPDSGSGTSSRGGRRSRPTGSASTAGT